MDNPKTGKPLQDDIDNLTIIRNSIVDEFIYERDTIMIPAEAGAGKSIILTQIAMHISSGTPVFGSLNVPKPRKVFYLQLEGDYEESIERMRRMKERVTMNPENLCWLEWKQLDVMHPLSPQLLLTLVENTKFRPDLFIIDPIYKMASHDIASGDAAVKIVKFSDAIFKKFGCSVLFAHHTHRSKYASDGVKINEDNPYYGHSFINNHIRTAYLLKHGSDRNHPVLQRKKGRGSDTRALIQLEFDAESMTVWMNESRGHSFDKLRQLAKHLKDTNKVATFNEICDITGLSLSHVRRLIKDNQFAALFLIDKSNHRKTLYRPK